MSYIIINIIFFNCFFSPLFLSFFRKKLNYHCFLKEWISLFRELALGVDKFFFLLLTFSRFSSSPLIREANKSIYYTVAGVQTWELRPTVTNNPANHLPRSSALLFAHICIPESEFHYSYFLLITDLNQGENAFGYSFWFFPPKKYIIIYCIIFI